jgi:hypothetical protein
MKEKTFDNGGAWKMNKKNGLLDIIMTRRSIRDFKEGDIPFPEACSANYKIL